MPILGDAKKYSYIYFFLWGATIAITIAVFFLLVPSEYWHGKFFLSLTAILLAETLIVAYPLGTRLTNAATPLQLGAYSIFWTYLIVTLVLSMIATTSISFNHLFAIHLVLFLLLLLSSGAVQIGKIFISNVSQAREEEKHHYKTFKEDFNKLFDKINLIDNQELRPVKDKMIKLIEDIRYSTAEMLPGAEEVNARLDKYVLDIDKSITIFESLVNSNQSLDEEIKKINGLLQIFAQTIEERERLTKSLRK